MPRIIALCGKQRAGKSATKKALTDLFRSDGFEVVNVSFAEPVKAVVAAVLHAEDVSYPTLNGGFFETYSERTFTPEEWKIAHRPALIACGNKLREYDPDVWVRIAVECMKALGPDAFVILDDVRFVNEAEALRAAGALLVRIEARREVRAARGELKNENDASETALDDYAHFDAYVDGEKPLPYLVDDVLFAAAARGLLVPKGSMSHEEHLEHRASDDGMPVREARPDG